LRIGELLLASAAGHDGLTDSEGARI
jgi:hypothetical protein